MNRENNSNNVTLSGELVSNFEFSHEAYGEKFYTAMLASKRLSDTTDIIPIMASDRLVDTGADWIGANVDIIGRFRSYNKHEGRQNRLILSVFLMEFGTHIEKFGGDFKSDNRISLDGYICKEPIYRKTPLGREIADILLAVNRPYDRSDYIPCIAWGRNARFADGLEVGTKLQIKGRIQSREYRKWLSEFEYEIHTAYEVSISRLEVIDSEQGKD